MNKILRKTLYYNDSNYTVCYEVPAERWNKNMTTSDIYNIATSIWYMQRGVKITYSKEDIQKAVYNTNESAANVYENYKFFMPEDVAAIVMQMALDYEGDGSCWEDGQLTNMYCGVIGYGPITCAI